MIDFTEISSDGETWELFARDFLEQLGFYIESPPDRGADGGKDMLISEQVAGHLHRYRHRWLVSCKHFAHSGRSVSENKDEHNILERVKAFGADGFIGFYSTLPSAGLNTRLRQLADQGQVRGFHIFDGGLIENHLITKGFSRLSFRYFPESHKRIRPIHNVIDEYVPLKCDHCGKDLLEALYSGDYFGIVAQEVNYDDDGISHVLDVYFSCKGECDRILENRVFKRTGHVTAWEDLTDIATPNQFLRLILATINQLADGKHKYSDSALEKHRTLIIALAQKIFREVTEKERARLAELMQFGL